MRHPSTFYPILFFSLFSFSAMGQERLEKTITTDGQEREYLLYVPAAYDGSEEWPLVLNLHGYTGDGYGQALISRMNPVADTAHFLVAYPDGEMVDVTGFLDPDIPLPTQGNGWNLGGLFSDNDDVAFLEQMIDQISLEYSVDNSRIFAVGNSMGGGMTYMLACTLSGRFAAIATVSGSQARTEGNPSIPCEPASPLPVLLIYGADDNISPPDGGPFFLGAEGTVDFWRSHNNCSSAVTEVSFEDTDPSDQSTVTGFLYTDCDGGSEVWHYRIDGGGHWWPGGGPLPPGFEIAGPVNRDINASAEIWNFFNRQALTSTEPYLKPSEINLRAYPNPAATQLTFAFELPEAARVQLTLYNPLGQPVQVLADENLPAGRQRIGWERPASVAAGLYYYRLQVGGRFVARPVVLR